MELTKQCIAVANYIIEEINKFNKGKKLKEQISITAKKLQKLLYFCDVEYMKRNNGNPLFKDDFYAWPSGPVIPRVYYVFMQYEDGEMQPRYDGNNIRLSKEIKDMIDLVLESTKDLDTIDLVDMSSVIGGPWARVFDANAPEHEQLISKKDIYDYYLNKVTIPKIDNDEVIRESLYQDEIIKLEDKDLQLRYILGGLYPHGGQNCDIFWGCDIRCSTQPVPNDENLEKVKKFISNHNISNSTFLRLARSYLFGTINSYKGDWGNLIPELDKTIMGYNFKHTNYESYRENELKEKELLQLIVKEVNIEGSDLNNCLTKYSLTPVDFIILAKTSINYKFKPGRYFERSDLAEDLKDILMKNNIYESYEFVISYRNNLEEELLKQNKPKSLFKKIKNKVTNK